jgi:hypothetical protein
MSEIDGGDTTESNDEPLVVIEKKSVHDKAKEIPQRGVIIVHFKKKPDISGVFLVARQTRMIVSVSGYQYSYDYEDIEDVEYCGYKESFLMKDQDDILISARM